jgi:hypothetical protein
VKKVLKQKSDSPSVSSASTKPGSSSTFNTKENSHDEPMLEQNSKQELLVKQTSIDFQKQEELDMNEIKKNSHIQNNLSQSQEQYYDEASNLVSFI